MTDDGLSTDFRIAADLQTPPGVCCLDVMSSLGQVDATPLSPLAKGGSKTDRPVKKIVNRWNR